MAKATKKSAKAKKKGAKAHAKSKNGLSTLRVRMYRVGFGDFFLVTVPSNDGPKHILIDCGVTRGKSGKGDIATIKSAVRHMAAETGGELALIVMTHRHQDHIIGFSRCAEVFEKFKVEAIWMPYWETEYEPKVKGLQADLETIALGLRAAALAGAPDERTAEILAMMENATGLSMAAEGPGGGTNAKSLDLLKNRLGVKPEYYYKGQKPKLPESLLEADVAAEILGPPPPDEWAFLQMMDLKKGVGQYLGLGNGGAGNGRRASQMPFGPQYVADATAYPPSAFREFAPRRPHVLPDFSKRYPEALEKAVDTSTPAALFRAAKKLDDVLNNQSLVVLFTWKTKKFLFAGDAQAGNWQYWLYDLDKPTKDASKEALSADSSSILGTIDFYKVGHHGSTNATPISAVGAMGKDFVSMCSVQEGTFGKVENSSEVPRTPLLEGLSKKSALVRSDQVAVDLDEVQVAAATKAKLPTPKQGSFEVGSCYIDYLL
jgi:beta-lactamase superfamily II metal-dependent hydrolase